MPTAVHNGKRLRWRVRRREAARFRPRRTRKRVRRPNIVRCLTTATAATNKGQPGRDQRQRTVQVLVLCVPLCPTLSLPPTMRELKYHEKKLLKKVDFLNVRLVVAFRLVASLRFQWKQDGHLREIKVMRRYHIQHRDDYHKSEMFLLVLSNTGLTRSEQV